jgi:O-antigen/teichoic acid export membrane protein
VADIPRLVWSAVTMQVLFGLLGAALLYVYTPALVDQVLKIPTHLAADARTMFRLLALAIPIVLASGSLAGGLEAAQRYDLLNLVRVPSSALTFLLPLVGVLFGLALSGIVALMLAARVGACLSLGLLAARVFPGLRAFSASREVLDRLLRFGGWIMLISVLGPILVYTDRFLLGTLVGLAAVAYYTAPFEIINRLLMVPSSLAAALFPALSSLGAGDTPEQRERAQQLFLRALRFLALITCPAVLVLAAIAPDALQLWLGPEFAQRSALALQILLIGALAICIAPVPANLIQAFGRPDLMARLYLMFVPLNALVVWLLVRRFGVAGAALSFTIRAWVESAVLLVLSSRLIGVRLVSLQRAAIFILAFAALLAGAVLVADPYVRLGIAGGGLLLFVTIAWRFVLDDVDRGVVQSVVGVGGGRAPK